MTVMRSQKVLEKDIITIKGAIIASTFSVIVRGAK